MKFIEKKGKVFIFELKDNRLVTNNGRKRNQGQFERLDRLGLPEETPMKVWIKDLGFPVRIFKQVFKNKDGSEGVRFLAANDSTLKGDQFRTLHKKRRSIVEPLVREYHKSLKQNASIGDSSAHGVRTQSNRLFAAVFGYVKLEMLKLAAASNHFALKTKIYMISMWTAMTTFQELWKNTEKLAFA